MISESNRPSSLKSEVVSVEGRPVDHKSGSHWVTWVVVLALLLGGGYLLSRRGTSTTAAKGGSKKGKGGGGPIPVAAEKVKQGDMGIYIGNIGTVTRCTRYPLPAAWRVN